MRLLLNDEIGGCPVKESSTIAKPLIAIALPDLRGGGAERVAINLANAFLAKGVAVDMVVMRAGGELAGLLDPKVQIIDLGARRARGVFGPLRRYLNDARPSSLLAFMWPLTVVAVAARAASRSKPRLVVAEHTTWSASERSNEFLHPLILAVTLRIAFPFADGVVSVSRGAAKDLGRIARLPVDKVTTIYNPIVGGVKSPALEQNIAWDAWADGSHHKILAVGTLKAIKDYPTLLRAFALLSGRMDVKLLILGEGPERSSLERLVRELGIQSAVFLPGFSSAPERFFARADVHVLSSTGEGFGNVIVEALEQGVPVVSTDCPCGPREILDNGRYGSLVPVGDPEALAGAIRGALETIHSKDVLKRRAGDFSVEVAASAYLDLLLPAWRKIVVQEEASSG